MRGYFGVGVEGISKAMNVGSIFRTAHAFGASFVFTVAAVYNHDVGRVSDTSKAPKNMPFYGFPSLETMILPHKCELVGVELTDDAVDLPSFHHPRQAAYILGPERGSLSAAMTARCTHVVKIPTQFCVNVGIAAAIVMYDRAITLGRFARRPPTPGGPVEDLPGHVQGGPKLRREMDAYRMTPPNVVPGTD